MTLYSNAINVTPYSGEQHYMQLPANGKQAPAEPGLDHEPQGRRRQAAQRAGEERSRSRT